MLGYQHCTAVQAESLGPLLSGADMVVKAKTGTGKTLAFLIPGIEQVSILAATVPWLASYQCHDDLTVSQWLRLDAECDRGVGGHLA